MIGAMPDDYAALHGTEDIGAMVAGRQIASRSLPDGEHAIVEDEHGSQQVWLRSDPSGRHDAYLLPHVGLEKHLGALLRFLDIPARGRFSLRHHLDHGRIGQMRCDHRTQRRAQHRQAAGAAGRTDRNDRHARPVLKATRSFGTATGMIRKCNNRPVSTGIFHNRTGA
jgi:hypothetical protein